MTHRSIGDKVVTVVLSLSVAALATVVVRREFSRPDSVPLADASRPEYISNWRALLTAGTTFGSRDAPIQIIEFADLQCPACRDEQEVINEAKKRFGKKLAVTFVHFPLSYHAQAVPGARAAECARRDGTMEAFVEHAYRQQRMLGKTPWTSIANDAGVRDLDSFAKCLSDTSTVEAIERGLAAGVVADVGGTPTVIVNGWKFRYSPRQKVLTDFIDDLLRSKYPSNAPVRTAMVPKKVQIAGVQVATFDTLDFAAAPQFGLANQKLASLGGPDSDPAYDLTNAEGAIILTDGRYAIYSGIDTRLLVFDSTGAPLRSLVRRGAGPGEVQRLMNAVRGDADTIIVADFVNRRANWYTASKGFARSLRFANISAPRAEYLVGQSNDGELIFHDGGLLPLKYDDGQTRLDAHLMRLEKSGSTETFAAVADMTVQSIETRFGGKPGRMALPLRLGPKAYFALWGNTVVTGNGESYHLDIRNLQGHLTSAISVNVRRRAVDAAIRNADLEVRLADLARQGEPAGESLRLRKEWPVADSLAQIGGLFVTPNQTLWVLDALIPGEDEWHATAYNDRLEMVGRMSHRSFGIPVGFGDDRVVLRSADEDGSVSFTALRIIPRLLGKALKN